MRIGEVLTMDEYIKKEAVLDLFGEVPAYTGYETYPVGVHTLICEIAPLIKDEIRKIPAADVAPVRHGRWIDAYPDIEPNPMFMYGICSECGFEQGISKYLNYCPNCGCRMDGGVENGDS